MQEQAETKVSGNSLFNELFEKVFKETIDPNGLANRWKWW